ncbi:probable pectate lyase 5 [Arachis stenosperma]|uniref:probable pectate lyase 5 n=1 Tax=Arachis stenosperma TaxID=217475 RepID=UPI0025ACAEB5|nr:probable pectate lyase 5 [Arachis stenosperma]
MADWFLLMFQFLLLSPALTSSSPLVQDPESVVQELHKITNNSKRNLAYFSCGTGNPIDDCWRCDPNWERNRKRLTDCAIGFGRRAIGGRDGKYYVVTNPSDHAMDPKPGTLRHAVIQEQPLWIIFKHDMFIKLKMDLLVNSHKTIDGRGANIHIGRGPCIEIRNKSNIIIHGIHIHDCVRGGSGYVRDSNSHFFWRSRSDGDGVLIYGSSFVWVDHCSFSNCYDGLIDVVHGSTGVTISNNYMTHHNKVMLLGHSDSNEEEDKNMQVTVAFNHFGEGLGGRMPRCRFGYFHVVNNYYTHWQQYAIGGSSSPTIFSQGNRFVAPHDVDHKEVTKHFGSSKDEWKRWNWRSEGDLMLNGAFFTESGDGAPFLYEKASSMEGRPAMLVTLMTAGAGALACKNGQLC